MTTGIPFADPSSIIGPGGVTFNRTSPPGYYGEYETGSLLSYSVTGIPGKSSGIMNSGTTLPRYDNPNNTVPFVGPLSNTEYKITPPAKGAVDYTFDPVKTTTIPRNVAIELGAPPIPGQKNSSINPFTRYWKNLQNMANRISGYNDLVGSLGSKAPIAGG